MPTVVVTSTAFSNAARGVASSLRMPDIPFIVLPHPIGGLTPEAARALAEKVSGEALKALTLAPRTHP